MRATQDNLKIVAFNVDKGVWRTIKDIAYKQGRPAAEFGRLFMKQGLENYLSQIEGHEETV